MVHKAVLDAAGLITHMDAVIDICERNHFPIEDVGGLIDDALRGRIEAEASKLNMLKDVSSASLGGALE